MCISTVTKIQNIQNIQVMANQNKNRYRTYRLGCDGRESCFKHGE